MPVIVNESRNSFTLEGRDFEPAGEQWANATPAERKRYWQVVGELAYRRKLEELRRGQGVNGKPLERVLRRWGGPPLSPRYAGSRFQRYLDFREGREGVTVYWGHSWSHIVGLHRYNDADLAEYRSRPRYPKRDVVGLTVASQRYVADRARLWWRNRHTAPTPGSVDRLAAEARTPPKPRPRPSAVAAAQARLGLRFRPVHSDALVAVDAARLDAALREANPGYYVAPGGGGPGAKPGAYANAVAFLARARREGIAVDAPRFGRAGGSVDLGDGRHRWAALRAEGHATLVVGVPRSEAAWWRRRFGTGP